MTGNALCTLGAGSGVCKRSGLLTVSGGEGEGWTQMPGAARWELGVHEAEAVGRDKSASSHTVLYIRKRKLVGGEALRLLVTMVLVAFFVGPSHPSLEMLYCKPEVQSEQGKPGVKCNVALCASAGYRKCGMEVYCKRQVRLSSEPAVFLSPYHTELYCAEALGNNEWMPGAN
jgi:hypothetical protein